MDDLTYEQGMNLQKSVRLSAWEALGEQIVRLDDLYEGNDLVLHEFAEKARTLLGQDSEVAEDGE